MFKLTHTTLVRLHLLSVGVLVCICAYSSYQMTSAMQLLSSETHATWQDVTASDLSQQSNQRFRHLNDISFYSFLVLSVSATIIYVKHHHITAFIANLIGYFIILCITYFWLGDTLFGFQKTHGLWKGGFSASIIIVPLKLATASVITYAAYLAAKHFKNKKKPLNHSQ